MLSCDDSMQAAKRAAKNLNGMVEVPQNAVRKLSSPKMNGSVRGEGIGEWEEPRIPREEFTTVRKEE